MYISSVVSVYSFLQTVFLILADLKILPPYISITNYDYKDTIPFRNKSHYRCKEK